MILHPAQPPLRKEDDRLLRGRARFVDDVRLHRMAHAAFVRSPVPHAEIIRVDGSKALAAGAMAVLTSTDVPFNDQPWVVRYWHPSIRNGLPRFLASDRVRFVGEAVALVMAEDRYRAEDLARLVEVVYRPLPPIASIEDAAAEDAALLHAQWTGNIAAAFEQTHGDAARALSDSKHRVRRQFNFARQAPVPLEPRGVVADFDFDQRALTLWLSTQPHYNVRQNLSTLLGMPEDDIRVICEDVGGGFGSKSRPYPEEMLVAHASRVLRRPVKWIEDRLENFQATTHSRAMHIDLEIGCDAKGRLTALRAEIVLDIGGYVFTSGIATAEVAAAHVPIAYRFPNIAIAVRCIGTNKTPVGTYRGAGQPEVTFAMECLLDVLAKEIRVGAADLRARNLVRCEEMPYRTGTSLFGNPLTHENANFLRALAAAIEASGYSEQVQTAENGERIAFGMACGVETGGLVNFESAHVRVHSDGAVSVRSGMSSQGQGQLTTYAQVCADALGVPFNCVTVRLGDTHLLPFGRGAFAARGAVIGANAVLGAAQRVRAQALGHAATLLQCSAAELDISNAEIRYQDGASTDLTLAQVARAIAPGGPLFQGELALEARFIYEAREPLTSGFSVHVAKIRIDPCTGFFRIEDYLVIHDAGRALNPMVVDGQIAGGVAEGIGGAVLAEMIYDAGGQPLTTSLADYLVATAPELPRITLVHVDSPSTTNPLGVRPVGEGGVIPAAATLTNAVARAIDPMRSGHEVALFSLPLKPQRVLAAWQDAARARGS